MTHRQLSWQPEKYRPVGRCIFCGATQGAMTDEHVIPFGLQPKGSDWYLPKAACPECQNESKKFEGAVQQGMLGPARLKLGLKSRRRKLPNIDVTLNYRDGGRLETSRYGIERLPLYAIGFRFPQPGLLAGRPPDDHIVGETTVRGELKGLPISDGVGMKLGRVYPLDFCRMLAKIGHTYATAKFGGDSFRPVLLDLIAGRSSTALHFLGADVSGPVPDQPNVLHDIYRQDCLSGGLHYMLIAIRLFAFMGMPRYHVVVGEIASG